MKINMYTKAFYLLTNEICSKYVISVKFSICEYKKVAVQPYSGDELCSAISWKDMESGIDTIQCKISCSHIFERISIALLKVKSILWALWVGRFSPLRQCVLRTHMHTAVTAGLYYISPGHDILSLDFTILLVWHIIWLLLLKGTKFCQSMVFLSLDLNCAQFRCSITLYLCCL